MAAPRPPREVPRWRLELARAYHAAAGEVPQLLKQSAEALGLKRPR